MGEVRSLRFDFNFYHLPVHRKKSLLKGFMEGMQNIEGNPDRAKLYLWGSLVHRNDP